MTNDDNLYERGSLEGLESEPLTRRNAEMFLGHQENFIMGGTGGTGIEEHVKNYSLVSGIKDRLFDLGVILGPSILLVASFLFGDWLCDKYTHARLYNEAVPIADRLYGNNDGELSDEEESKWRKFMGLENGEEASNYGLKTFIKFSETLEGGIR